MDPIQFSAKLHFINTLSGGKTWYPNEWNRWRTALFDGTAGPLVHPDLGEVNARVLRGSVRMDAQTTAGVVVDVTWTTSLDDPEAELEFTFPAADVSSVAQAADVLYQELGFEYPDGMGDGVGFFEAWNQIKGGIISAGMTVEGAVNQFLNQVASCIEDVAALGKSGTDHVPALDALKRLWSAVKDVAENAGLETRPVGAKVVASQTTLTAFAKETGNTLNEVMGLNLSALGKPIVPAGTTLKYYK